MRRIERPGPDRFLTFSCRHRLPLFGNTRIRDLFAKHLDAARAGGAFLVHAWVVMPEHIHLLLFPTTEDGSLARDLGELKRAFAQDVIKRWRELEAPILARITEPSGGFRFWQPGGGYDRLIYTYDEFWEKVDYTNSNPVRRGLVQLAIDWPWSSARAYAGMGDSPVKIAIEPR